MSTGSLTKPAARLGDVAAGGLIHGLIAGAAMAAYLVAVALLAGEGLTVILARFDGAGAVSAPRGALLHLAVSSVYGVSFALLQRLLDRHSRVPGPLAGLLFGLALFLVAELVLLPGSGSPLRDIPVLHFGTAHAVYGLALGALSARSGHGEAGR